MMFAQATNWRLQRMLLRAASVVLAATLLAGSPLMAARAWAQAQAGDDKAADKPDKTDKADNGAAKNNVYSVGDDTIDPNQPIKPNFLINVSVVGENEPSGTYPVDPAGNISIKYAGVMSPIRILGLTPKQAEAKIKEFLKMYVKNPDVTVTIINVPRPVIFVAGAVRNAGPFAASGDTALVDVLSKAEWTENADLSNIRVIRREKVGDEEKSVTTYYNFDKFISAKSGNTPDESQNPILHDKDRVIVPFKTTTAKGTISVYGEVVKPQREIPLPSGQILTVREAINLVGGTNTTANRKSITIRRASVDRPLIIDLDKAEQGDPVYNIELKSDDSIYVEKLENNAYINLNGGFVKPGKFVYDKRTTLTQAIGEAGGPAPFARAWDGVIFRHPDDDPKHSRVIAFNWIEISKGKKPDVELQPGDTVMLPPGTPPRPPIDVFSAISGLSSATYLYNSIAGRYIYH
jgi:protein involved in polysaccharide export with SLBB domain